MDWEAYNFRGMEITLPPDLEAYVDQRVRGGAFVSATELIQEALRRKMETDSWMEEKVIEAEQSELSGLTREDLDSVRRLIRQPCATRTSNL
jgi:putative addiction module CopG family antidote